VARGSDDCSPNSRENVVFLRGQGGRRRVTANARGSLLLAHRWAVQSQKRGEVEDTVQEQCPMQLTGHTLRIELGADNAH
jgi:hypothetical protein